MYVTEHARLRLTQRLGVAGLDLSVMLQEHPGERGTVAYLVCDWPPPVEPCFDVRGPLGPHTHGQYVVVAIAVDGSVETVYLRRVEQDMSPGSFGLARKVVDLR